MDLRLLHSFVAVAETEHVGRAAERLHISQSPLSRQIRQLEEQLGLQLFERERQRIRLTDAGRWLLEESRDLLGRALRVERDAARRVHGEQGRLSIGFVNAALWHPVMQTTLRRFQRSLPKVQLDLRALTTESQVLALQSGELDLGLARRGLRPELVCLPLFDEPFTLALPARHRLAVLDTIRPKDLRDQPWVSLSRAVHPAAHALLADMGRRAGFVPEVRHEAGDRGTMLALVASGLGVALLPSSAQRLGTPGVAFRPLPWLTTATRIDVMHPTSPSAAARQFAEIALATAAELLSPGPRPASARRRSRTHASKPAQR